MPSTTPLAAWLALPQPFLAREARAVGLTSTAVAGAIRRRQLVAVAPQVYAVAQSWSALSPTQAHVALARAAQVSVAGSVVSHASAALVQGLPRPWGPLDAVSLTVRGSTRTAAHEDWRRVLDGALPDEHVTELDGVPVTTPARTVVDCLRCLRPRDGLAVADAALRAGATDSAELRQVRRSQRRWPGIRKADLGLWLADGERESWLESASVSTAIERGWPMPMSQVSIHHPDGRFVGRVDLLWGSLGVVGEADGRGKYLGSYEGAWDAERAADAMLRERDRERQLESLGLAVARWGTGELRDRGTGLDLALRQAAARADPGRVRCLWRRQGEDLRPWSELPPPRHPTPHLLPAGRQRRRRNAPN